MDKLSIYEFLFWIVPGTLLLGFLAMMFPDQAKLVSSVPGPDAFKVSFLAAMAIFAGQIAQAIASAAEPLLHWTWGGRPSETALAHGLGERYVPQDSAGRIRRVLAHAVGQEASNRSLFLFAMQRAESVADSKAKSFNAQYAYHRVLLTLTTMILVVFATAWVFNAVEQISRGQSIAIVLTLIGLEILLWYRTRQRAYYYVREVLLSAERLIAPPTAIK